MPKKREPSLKFMIKTSDGAKLESSGPCTDREGFGVYMIGRGAEADTPLGKALEAFLTECEKVLAERAVPK